MAYFDFLAAFFSKKKAEAQGEGESEGRLPGLSAGKRMKIALVEGSEEEDEILLATTFDGFEEGGLLLVSAPVYRGAVFEMPVGEEYTVTYNVEKDTYRLACRVLKNHSEGELAFLLLERVSGVEKIERRNDYRLPVTLCCNIKRALDNGEEELEAEYDADVLNISVGGVQLMIPALLEKGEELFCALELGDYGELELFLEVKWVEPMLQAADVSFKAGCQFLRLEVADENNLTRYIVTEQLRRRRSNRGI